MPNSLVPPGSGISQSTPSNVIFGAGTLHINLVYTASTGWNFTDTVIGATAGGNSVQFTPNLIPLNPDGVGGVDVAGLIVHNGDTVEISFTPIEFTQSLITALTLFKARTTPVAPFDLTLEPDGNLYLPSTAFVNLSYVFENVQGGFWILSGKAYFPGGLTLPNQPNDKTIANATARYVAELSVTPGLSYRQLPVQLSHYSS